MAAMSRWPVARHASHPMGYRRSRQRFPITDSRSPRTSILLTCDYSGPMKTIHVAEVTAQGGRDGEVEAAGRAFAVSLSTEEGPDSVTPEHLFAGAYASCYLSALKNAAETAHLSLQPGTVVTA